MPRLQKVFQHIGMLKGGLLVFIHILFWFLGIGMIVKGKSSILLITYIVGIGVALMTKELAIRRLPAWNKLNRSIFYVFAAGGLAANIPQLERLATESEIGAIVSSTLLGLLVGYYTTSNLTILSDSRIGYDKQQD